MALFGLFGRHRPAGSPRVVRLKEPCNRALDRLDDRRRRSKTKKPRGYWDRQEEAIRRRCERQILGTELAEERAQEKRDAAYERAVERRERKNDARRERIERQEEAKRERKRKAIERWEAKHGRKWEAYRRPATTHHAPKADQGGGIFGDLIKFGMTPEAAKAAVDRGAHYRGNPACNCEDCMKNPAKFDRLEKHIQREYREKGYSPEEARHIGFATAGKVAREKEQENPMDLTDHDDKWWFLAGAAVAVIGGAALSHAAKGMLRRDGITVVNTTYGPYGEILDQQSSAPRAHVNPFPKGRPVTGNDYGNLAGCLVATGVGQVPDSVVPQHNRLPVNLPAATQPNPFDFSTWPSRQSGYAWGGQWINGKGVNYPLAAKQTGPAIPNQNQHAVGL